MMPFNKPITSPVPRRASPREETREAAESIGSIEEELANNGTLEAIPLNRVSSQDLTRGNVAIVLPSARDVIPQLSNIITRAGSQNLLPVFRENNSSPRPIDNPRYLNILETTFRRVTPTELRAPTPAADMAGGDRAPRVQFTYAAVEATNVVELGRGSTPSSARSSSLNFRSIVAQNVYDPHDPRETYRGTHFMVNPVRDVVVTVDHIREQLQNTGTEYLTQENFRHDLQLLNSILTGHIDRDDELHGLVQELLRKLSIYNPAYMQQYLADVRAENQNPRVEAARSEGEEARQTGRTWLPLRACSNYRQVATTEETEERNEEANAEPTCRSCNIM